MFHLQVFIVLAARAAAFSAGPPAVQWAVSRSTLLLRSTVSIDSIPLNYGLVPTSHPLAEWHSSAYGKYGGGLLVSSATTLPGALAQLWAAVADLADKDSPGSATTLLFPDCSDLRARGTLERLMDHLETCKDVCENFGATVSL